MTTYCEKKSKEKRIKRIIVIILLMICIGVFLVKTKTGNQLAENIKTMAVEIINNAKGNSIEEKNKIIYEIDIVQDDTVVINATKDENTISAGFQLGSLIDRVGTTQISGIGNVALVSETGGEYCNVNVFQQIDDSIKLIGNIDCGLGMVKEADYEVKKKDEKTVTIKSKIGDKQLIDNIKLSGEVVEINIMECLEYGKLVLLTEVNNNNYDTQVYRVNQNTEGERVISKVGIISDLFSNNLN